MNSETFLQYLLDEVHGTETGASGTAILRFKCSTEYQNFIRKWTHLTTSEMPLPSIRGLGIIQAISCPIPVSDKWLDFPCIQSVEEDEIVTVHGMKDFSFNRMEHNIRSSVSQVVPWGVKHIRAPQVWKGTTGNRVKIGVVDTGIDYNHPDLRNSISKGINLINRNMLPIDDNGHGTHISGTIAAASSRQGIIGVAPRAIIHPVKAFDHNGSAFVSDIIYGIDWCVQNGLHLINMSFGMKNYSRALDLAVRNAFQSGTIIVASSGNDSQKASVDYPARFPQVISVGATTKTKKIAPFSNRGKRIDIYAPGEQIISTWLNGKYNELSGTSMATSHVTGVIALMLAIKPNLHPMKIKQILKRTAIPLVKGKVKSPGEIHAKRAISALNEV